MVEVAGVEKGSWGRWISYPQSGQLWDLHRAGLAARSETSMEQGKRKCSFTMKVFSTEEGERARCNVVMTQRGLHPREECHMLSDRVHLEASRQVQRGLRNERQ